ncbi:MAG: biopolymer transporter ExbD [Candidatus Eisenbacteria bacterium]
MDFGAGSKGYLQKLESTAMSDIIFNLLIFFLLSSSFVVQSGIQVDLPQVVAPVQLELKKVVVTLKADGTVFVNDQQVEWKDLRTHLGEAIEAAPDKQVVIRGDDKAALGRAVEIWDTARELGATGLAVATRAKEPGEKP